MITKRYAVETFSGLLAVDDKPIMCRTFSGTTPNNASDNAIFAVAGCDQFYGMEGYIEQSGVLSRRVNVNSAYSGNASHGPMFQFYPNDKAVHVYNATGDARWQNCPYMITVYYTK